jgi:hypothetical protein
MLEAFFGPFLLGAELSIREFFCPLRVPWREPKQKYWHRLCICGQTCIYGRRFCVVYSKSAPWRVKDKHDLQLKHCNDAHKTFNRSTYSLIKRLGSRGNFVVSC